MGKDDDDERKFVVNRKVMLAAIGSLLGVVMIIILLHLYARYLLRRQERRRRAAAELVHSRGNQVFVVDDEVGSINEQPPNKSSGLEPLVIASLPTFTYKLTATGQVGEDQDECSVCLATITEGSAVRLLPNCKHGFHVECIDTWLGSHTTCPICRTPAEPRVQPEDKVQPTAPPIEENVSHCAAQVEKEGRSSASASGSGPRFDSFRRMLGRDRSSRRIQSCVDEVGTQDLERQ